MTIAQGVASYPSKPTDPALRQALLRAEAHKAASDRLANLHPHEWAVLYEAALRERGLTD